jgi:hypothetical protein
MVNEVVIPDTLRDMSETIQQAWKFEKVVSNWPQFRYMAVVQGKTYDDLQACAHDLAVLPYVNTIAIPRHVESTVGPGTRVRLAEFIATSYGQEIHLLGTNPENMGELRVFGETYRMCGVRGVDTATPYYYSMANRSLYAEATQRPKDYYDREIPNSELLMMNIAVMKEWVYGH